MTHYISCPICSKILQPCNDPNNLICGKESTFIEEINYHVDTIHAMYCLSESGSILLKVIEVPPFIFEIQQIPELGFSQTRILKHQGGRFVDKKTLLVLPGIISCPWNDRLAVIDKVKMLMLFS